MKKITQDGFAWQILDSNDAVNAYHNGVSIFSLYDDDSESQIITIKDLEDALYDDQVEIGIEIGLIKTSKVCQL
jgi:hypothetical protein